MPALPDLILGLIRARPGITTGAIADAVEVPGPRLRDELRRLSAQHLIHNDDPTNRPGCWVPVTPEDLLW